MANETSRRGFLKNTSLAATALAAPAVARGAASANERVRVALVGLGGRSRAHMDSLHALATENVELAALCDCDQKKLASGVQRYQGLSGKSVATYDDMRRLLDDDSIDAVSFATPNHWHALGVIWSCQAGKDAYVEKPGSHNVIEGRRMVEAARKYRRIVQHGTQCRSSENICEGIQKLHEGVIGRVYLARGIAYKIRGSLGTHKPVDVPQGLDWEMWLGPAEAQDYSHFHHRRWHWVWNTGNGDIGNQGVHQFDIIRWGLKLDQHPTSVQSMGGNYVHPDDSTQTPMVQTCAMQFGGRDVLVTFEVRDWFTNSEAGFRDEYPFVQPNFPVGTIFLGTEGYMIFPDYSSYHTFLGPKREKGPSRMAEGQPMKDVDHFRNWISAVRSRNSDELSADITDGHRSSALCHFANIAYRVGRTVQVDPETERILADEEAAKLLARENPSAKYHVPDKV